ncbi:MAG: cation:dicarboxylase symporter family transporter [Lentisphaerae bacterium]|nr:cation:dicarboxylase symporter family transporter [Lentisphaerota bacterium]MCP4101298.1 cation:dicarboxylase symporter family transporter [Lentisphaerota bacterium]
MRFKLPKMSLGNLIIIALVLGVVAGLFFGEKCSFLGIIGKAFVDLLQITVLPYILFALIHGIGSLSYRNFRRLAWKGSILLVCFYTTLYIYVFLAEACFPSWSSSSFFSTSTLIVPEKIDFLRLYIPSNPFYAMANNLVPAVTVFSILVGIALIGIKGKEKVLDGMSIFCKALGEVARMMVKLTPLGTFAITADAAGSMTLQEFGRIQVYLVTYLTISTLLTMLIVPSLIAMITPFKFKSVLNVSKDALLTAFATGNLFVIIPIIQQNNRTLFENAGLRDDESDSLGDILVPVVYNFPDAGKMLCLSFILFAGWFTGNTISGSDYFNFIFTGLLSLFGSLNLAIPFLLKQFQIPGDLFEIYLVAGVIISKFATMLAASFTFGFSLVCVCWLQGLLKFSLKKFIIFMTIIFVSTIIVISGTRIALSSVLKPTDEHKKMLESMHVKNPVKFIVLKKVPPDSALRRLFKASPEGHIARIRNRKELRVGYNQQSLPFSFFNPKGDLVGFDVDVVNRLARELGCKQIRFIPFKFDNVAQALENDYIDMAVSGLSINSKRIQVVDFTQPYMHLNMAFVCKDYQKDLFRDLNQMQDLPGLRIGVQKGGIGAVLVKKYLKEAVSIELSDIRDYFEGKTTAQILLTSAEQGSAWTILYPQYGVAIPEPRIRSYGVGYAVARGDQEFLNFLNYWLEIMRENNQLEKMYKYWVEGKSDSHKQRRWNIMEDVFKIKL